MAQVLGIAFAQFLGCSLWFSVNGISSALVVHWDLEVSDIGLLTGAVQAGFISGTLGLAVSNLADRFRPSLIFLSASLLGGLANLLFAYQASGLGEGLLYRFIVGVCLAGIYPIGMKLIVSWSPKLPGVGLGLVVGMLTLGTASPHLLNGLSWSPDWRLTLTFVSGLALIGGMLVVSIGEGPFGVKQTGPIQWGAVFKSFQIPRFRASAFGYFGHMWELYAFWTLVPWLLASVMTEASALEISMWSFVVIGIGLFGAVWGGLMSRRWGSGRVAFVSLAVSGSICVLYPFLEDQQWAKIGVLMVWGFFVIADSAQFSAISSKSCPPDMVGSALSIQNCLGFLISIGSIVLLTDWVDTLGTHVVWLLVPGPILGLIAMRSLFSDPGISEKNTV
ncbi:MAG: MFS transporter [Litorivicinaceae bacterium]|nr:MFS transporter [Litorivicinaceae bacterium]